MIDSNLRLLDNLSRDFCLVTGDYSTGVDNLVRPATPSHSSINAIASDAGFVGNNRATLTDQAIEESRFANIGPADDCNQAMFCGHSMNFAFLLEDSTSNWKEEFSG